MTSLHKIAILPLVAAAACAVPCVAQTTAGATYRGHEAAVFAVKSNPTVPLRMTF